MPLKKFNQIQVQSAVKKLSVALFSIGEDENPKNILKISLLAIFILSRRNELLIFGVRHPWQDVSSLVMSNYFSFCRQLSSVCTGFSICPCIYYKKIWLWNWLPRFFGNGLVKIVLSKWWPLELNSLPFINLWFINFESKIPSDYETDIQMQIRVNAQVKKFWFAFSEMSHHQ